MRAFPTRLAFTVGVLMMAGVAGADAPRAKVQSVDAALAANPIGTNPSNFTHLVVHSGVIVEAGEVKTSPVHVHRLEDHVFYVIRGRATARLGDETAELKPGDLVTIPRGLPHSVAQTGGEPFVVLAVVTDGWDVKKDTELVK